jgi:hypothetical protein
VFQQLLRPVIGDEVAPRAEPSARRGAVDRIARGGVLADVLPFTRSYETVPRFQEDQVPLDLREVLRQKVHPLCGDLIDVRVLLFEYVFLRDVEYYFPTEP